MSVKTKVRPEPALELDTATELGTGDQNDIGIQAGSLSLGALLMGSVLIAAAASGMLSGQGNEPIAIPDLIIRQSLRNWLGLSKATGLGQDELAFKIQQGTFFAGYIAAKREALGTLTDDDDALALQLRSEKGATVN